MDAVTWEALQRDYVPRTRLDAMQHDRDALQRDRDALAAEVQSLLGRVDALTIERDNALASAAAATQRLDELLAGIPGV